MDLVPKEIIRKMVRVLQCLNYIRKNLISVHVNDPEEAVNMK